MISNNNSSLAGIIVPACLNHDKLPMLLLLAVIASSILVVITTYQTRQLTVEREQILLETNVLDSEWRNLLLEENVLGEQIRVNCSANQPLQLPYLERSQEHIVLQP